MTPFLFLFRRECHRFFKVIVQTLVTPLVSSSLYLLIFGVSFGESIQIGGEKYLAFLIPGLMMMGLMNNSFQNSSSSLVSSKFTGDIEDYGVVPLTRAQIVWALSLAAVVRGSLVSMMTFITGQVFHLFLYREFLMVEHPFWLLFFMFFAGLSFGQLGLITAFWAKTFDQLSAISTFVILPLTYLGGVFISIDHLPEFWRSVSMVNPLFYFINGLRFSVLGQSDVPVQTAAFVALLVCGGMFLIARRVLNSVTFTRW